MISTLHMPRINTNDDRVEIVEWHVSCGDYVNIGQTLVDVETSKAVVTLEAEAEGHVLRLAAKGDIVDVGAPLCLFASTETELLAARAAAAPGTAAPVVQTALADHGLTRFSKAAERLLRERGIPMEQFAGAGLVTCAVIEARLGLTPVTAPSSINAATHADPATTPATARSARLPLAKQAEIQSLTIGAGGGINSQLSIHFNSAAIRARLLRDDLFDGSIQPLILHEISRLLRQWPQFTAYCDGTAIHYYDRVDFGLAFDLGHGLKVLTIKDADQLLPIQFHERTLELGLRYLDNRLLAEELGDATITITDLSSLDVLHFQPLINGRQSAIIGIGGDSQQAGHPMAIHLCFDHRIASGRDVALFLNELRARLLTYAAPPSAPDAGPGHEPAVSRTVAPIDACDVCGIDRERYYREFGRFAFLLAYVRADGSLGAACHRCAQGTT